MRCCGQPGERHRMVKAIERIFIFVLLGTVILVLLLVMGCSAHKPIKPTRAPGACMSVTHFGQACRPNAQGYICDKVQLTVKPDPACKEYEPNFLRVK